MDIFIVAVIVGLAVLYTIRQLWRLLRSPPDTVCDCGCSGCSQAPACQSEFKTIPPRP